MLEGTDPNRRLGWQPLEIPTRHHPHSTSDARTLSGSTPNHRLQWSVSFRRGWRTKYLKATAHVRPQRHGYEVAVPLAGREGCLTDAVLPCHGCRVHGGERGAHRYGATQEQDFAHWLMAY